MLNIRKKCKENEYYGKNVKIIWCDNSGEKKNLKENCAKNFEEIKFEFTLPGPPHQNGVVERGFATLFSRMRVMMAHARLHEKSSLSYVPNARQPQPNSKILW